MRHMRSLLLPCVVWILLFRALVAGADQCPSRIHLQGGVPQPHSPHETIRMDSGEVRIRLGQRLYTVDAVFEFFNTGETTTQRVGIPTLDNSARQTGSRACPGRLELHNSRLELPAPRGLIVGLLEPEAWVEGRRAALSEERDFLKASKRQGPPHYTPKRRWMVSNVTFPGHEKTTIRCRYKARYMPDRRVRFGYGTARAWKGNIGRLVFIIDCADVGGTDSVFVRRAFPKDSRREFRTENLIIMEERDSEPAGAAHLFLAANHYDHQIGYQLMCQEENYDARHGCLVPWGKPVQIWSRVNRDSKLTDSFFESDEWSYPWYIIKHGEGHFEDIGCANQPPRKEPPHLKHTAKCVSTSFGEDHAVHFCEAKLLDVNMIDLFINEYSSVFRDALRVRIINGMFTCQYWIPEIGPLGFYEYTTKRQKLTLDKKAYRKGDVIKGRIDFECVQEPSDPRIRGSWPRAPKTIKLSGVFKTIVE